MPTYNVLVPYDLTKPKVFKTVIKLVYGHVCKNSLSPFTNAKTWFSNARTWFSNARNTIIQMPEHRLHANSRTPFTNARTPFLNARTSFSNARSTFQMPELPFHLIILIIVKKLINNSGAKHKEKS